MMNPETRIAELETELAEARQEVASIAEVSRHAKGERDHVREQNRQVWALMERYEIAARGFRARDEAAADVFALVASDLRAIYEAPARADDGVDYDGNSDDE